MKIRAFFKFSVGLLVLGIIAFGLGSCSKPAPPLADSQSTTTTELAFADETDDDTPMEPLISAAPVHGPSDREIVVPANLKPSDAVADIIKLVNAGNDEALLLAFVTNSRAPFKVGAEELIYLSDIGVPPSVLTAMLQHDHMLPDEAVTLLTGTDDALSPSAANEVAGALPASFTADNSLPLQPALFSDPGLPSPSAAEIAEPQPITSSDSFPAESTITEFHDALAPYGTWVDVSGYGNCWQPTVAAVNPDWCPYADRGHWTYTDCGWYWASDYTWGWAPFHYGRWFQHARLGWCWVPGRVWSSAWVCWRQGPDVCGWAPLPPGARFNDGLRYHGLPVKPGFHFDLAADQFHFVPTAQLTSRHPLLNAIPRERVKTIFPRTVATTSFASVNSGLANEGIKLTGVSATRRPLPAANLVATRVNSHAPLPQAVAQVPAVQHTTATPIGLVAPAAPAPVSTVVSIGASHSDAATATQARPHSSSSAFVPLSTAVARNHPRPAVQPVQPAGASLVVNHSASGQPHPQPVTETIVLPNTHAAIHQNSGQSQLVANQPAQVPWWIPTPPPRNDHSSQNTDSSPDRRGQFGQPPHFGRQPVNSAQSIPASYSPPASTPAYTPPSTPQYNNQSPSEARHQLFSPPSSDATSQSRGGNVSAQSVPSASAPASPPVQHEQPAQRAPERNSFESHREQIQAAREAATSSASSSSHSTSSSDSHSSSSDSSGRHR